MNRLKFITDGSPLSPNTKLIDLETGENLLEKYNVGKIKFEMGVDDPMGILTLTILSPDLEVEGQYALGFEDPLPRPTPEQE